MPIFLRRRKLGYGSCHGIRKQSEHTIQVCRNDIRNRKGYPTGHEWLVRWGCTDAVPDQYRILNPSNAIHQVNDKAGFRRTLQNHDPELVPRTWFPEDNSEVEYPAIVRPQRHAQGRRLYVVNNYQELNRACIQSGPGYYISKLINKVAEYRIFVIQGRVANVSRKTPGNPNQIAWNVAQGGRFDNVRFDDWPLQAVRKAIEAMNLTELDFGGVDVMVDAEGKAYIIEINSAPSLPTNSDGTPTHRQLCMAKCFDYIFSRNSKEKIPLVASKRGYLKFIHPAINDRALMV